MDFKKYSDWTYCFPLGSSPIHSWCLLSPTYRAHIPGAAWFDIMRDVTHTQLRLRNLPEPEVFERQVRSVGVDGDTHVIVYDSQGQGGCFVGGRAWWMFKVCKIKFHPLLKF